MNWVSALAPWQWAVMLSIPPIVVLLYFLKLRRAPQVIPSTFLWLKALEDIQVNSFWQRLRRNLLMLLQLLFLLALILACLRPGIQTSSVIGERVIFLLDNSASMQATDLDKSRFEIAKGKIREEMESMASNQAGMLITFSNRADVQQGFTTDRSRLIQALNEAPISNRESDISQALRTAVGLSNLKPSNPQPTEGEPTVFNPATIRIFSDGRFAGLNEVELEGTKPSFISIGLPTSDNVGIVAFSLNRSIENPDLVQAFARVKNFSGTKQKVTLNLKLQGLLLDASEVELPANETRGIAFELDAPPPNADYVVTIQQADSLLADNTATATIRPERDINVLVVTEGSQALQKALNTGVIKELASVSFVDQATYTAWAKSGFNVSQDANSPFSTTFDLIIYDGLDIDTMPPTNTFFFGGSPAPTAGWTFGEPEDSFVIVDWDRAHPIMQFLTFANVIVKQGREVKAPDGSEVLMNGPKGSALSIARRGPFQDGVLGFGLRETRDGQTFVNTNWSIRGSFPVFMLGMLEYIGGLSSQRVQLNVHPGEPAVMSVPTRIDRFEITMPDGQKKSVQPDGGGQLTWTDTEQPGLYRIASAANPDVPLDAFVVNLLSNDESQIAAVETIQFSNKEIAQTETETLLRREYWRWLLVIGLVLLFLEWTVYTRRILV